MTITSIGYDGTVDEQAWAKLSLALGAREGVLGAGHWAVSVKSGADRTVSVASGSGFGHGVRDDSDAVVDVQLPVRTGAPRWDTIVARRDWAANTTSFQYLQGTTTQAIASGLNDNPGVIADQPIALVQITEGVQEPTAIVDLRTWPGKVVFANTLPDPAKWTVGTIASVGADLYRRESPGGTPTWVKMFAPAWSSLSLSSGIVGSGTDVPQYRVVGDCLELRGSISKSDGTAFSNSGTLQNIATLPVGAYPPSRTANVPVTAFGTTALNYSGRVNVQDGLVRFATKTADVYYVYLDGVRVPLS